MLESGGSHFRESGGPNKVRKTTRSPDARTTLKYLLGTCFHPGGNASNRRAEEQTPPGCFQRMWLFIVKKRSVAVKSRLGCRWKLCSEGSGSALSLFKSVAVVHVKTRSVAAHNHLGYCHFDDGDSGSVSHQLLLREQPTASQGMPAMHSRRASPCRRRRCALLLHSRSRMQRSLQCSLSPCTWMLCWQAISLTNQTDMVIPSPLNPALSDADTHLARALPAATDDRDEPGARPGEGEQEQRAAHGARQRRGEGRGERRRQGRAVGAPQVQVARRPLHVGRPRFDLRQRRPDHRDRHQGLRHADAEAHVRRLADQRRRVGCGQGALRGGGGGHRVDPERRRRPGPGDDSSRQRRVLDALNERNTLQSSRGLVRHGADLLVRRSRRVVQRVVRDLDGGLRDPPRPPLRCSALGGHRFEP
eukprot:scaffold11242_cov61-Phaeocystis_antarctica.AAC.4